MSGTEEEVSAERVALVVRTDMAESAAPFSAFWIQVTGDRDSYATSLRRQLQGAGVFTLVLRESLFD